jgi:hypothetical protein
MTDLSSIVRELENRAIAFEDLDEGQKRSLRDLVEEYASVQAPLVAEQRLNRIDKGGWNDLILLLMGGVTTGDAMYYRIRSRAFVIEYINKAFSRPQDKADHQYSAWRDFQEDWGRNSLGQRGTYGPDVVKHHYEHSSHHSAHGAPHARHHRRQHRTYRGIRVDGSRQAGRRRDVDASLCTVPALEPNLAVPTLQN